MNLVHNDPFLPVLYPLISTAVVRCNVHDTLGVFELNSEVF